MFAFCDTTLHIAAVTELSIPPEIPNTIDFNLFVIK